MHEQRKLAPLKVRGRTLVERQSPLSQVFLSPGNRGLFSIAGLGIEFDSGPSTALPLELPRAFEAFADRCATAEIDVRVSSSKSLGPCGAIVVGSGLNWRAYAKAGGYILDFHHGRSGKLQTAAFMDGDFRHCTLTFDETNWRWLWDASGPGQEPRFQLPHPLDQLLLMPRLAYKSGFLLHACGAVVDGKALVFAGHSGDGKTTLARLLAAEGLELLSDERIAIRQQNGVFIAYGTPWPGEGNVVSAAAYPLGGIFLLQKAAQHRVRPRGSSPPVAELLARSIVPYYFTETTARILSLVQDLMSSVAVDELEFSLERGLSSLLSRAALA